MTSKKKAIIHIGGHKTGSSAIQAFCVLNAVRLEKLGIVYPLELVSHIDRVGGQAHHCLVNLFMDDKTFWKAVNLRPKAMRDADIIAFLKDLPRDKNILLSSENLVWLDHEALAALQVYLEGFDVHVILYARRQDDALQALYQTVVASIGEAKEFAEYTSGDVHALFEYDKIAQKWQAVFGTENVVVRAYEPEQLYQRDSVLDFFQVLEGILQLPLDISGWERASGTINRGMPAHVTGLIRYHNGRFTKRWLVPVIKMVSSRLYKDSRGSYEIILPSERKALLESFAKSNENLARKFLGKSDGVLFYDLAIKQTDSEWDAKYNKKGSHLALLLRDIVAQFKVLKLT